MVMVILTYEWVVGAWLAFDRCDVAHSGAIVTAGAGESVQLQQIGIG